MRYYPVYLDLRGQRCVVIGSGKLAEEKVAALQSAGALVDWERGPYRPGRLTGARLVIDAGGDEETGRRVFEDAEAAGVLVNVVDVPSRCRFIAPAIVDRDPLLIAISTSGESPFLASSLRARLERTFGPEWGPFTALVGDIRRRLRRAGVPIAAQTAVYRSLLRGPARRLLRAGRAAEAERAAEQAAFAEGPARGRVTLSGAGPGAPDLLTLAARDLLADADVVFHDALVHPAVLDLCGPATEIVDVGKRGATGGADQRDIEARMIERARAGADVVRLKAGDPFVFGRGGEEAAALTAAGVDVVVVPGVSSATAAPAVAGIPVTHRGVAASFAVVTATTAPDSASRLAATVAAVDTAVIMMGRSRLGEIAQALAGVRGPDTPCALVASATWPGQRVLRATLATIANEAERAAIEAPATLVVGPAVDALPIEVAERLRILTASRA